MRFETSGQGSKNRIFTPFGDFYIDVENLFDQVMGNMPSAKDSNGEQGAAGKPAYRPAAKVVESESAFTVSLDLPGVDASDVAIELLDGELRVAGVRKIDEEPEGVRVMRDTRKQGAFENTFKLSQWLMKTRSRHPTKMAFWKLSFPRLQNQLLERLRSKQAIQKASSSS